MISISSNGEVDNNVNARTNLIVDEDCSIEWKQPFINTGLRSSPGTTPRTTRKVVLDNQSIYYSSNIRGICFVNLKKKVLKYKPVVIVGPGDILNGAFNVSVTLSKRMVKELERNKDGDINLM